MADIVISECELLHAYYDKRTLSSLPNGYEPYFQLGQAVWGHDLIEEIDGVPSVMPIPLDKTSIEGQFYVSDVNYQYVDGNIVISTNIPAGTFAEDEQHQFSCLGILDQAGDLVMVAVTQPVWLYSNRGLSIQIIVTTARSDSAVVV